MNKVLYTLVGLPRSGKSSWAKKQPWPIVNPDSIRLTLHGRDFYKPAEPFVWAIAQVMVNSLFIAGAEKVVLDATNITADRRKMWFNENWETVFVVFSTPMHECIKRAGDNAVLVKVIENMALNSDVDKIKQFVRAEDFGFQFKHGE